VRREKGDGKETQKKLLMKTGPIPHELDLPHHLQENEKIKVSLAQTKMH
jgi:hypothetical protein